MENNDIKKALECCVDGDCYPCPYAEIGAGCRDRMAEDALALINSQEQRIKELAEENVQFRDEQRKLIEENEKLLTVIFKKEDTMQIILQEHQAEYDSMAKSVNEASNLIRKLRADKEELINAFKKLSKEHEKILNHYFIDTTIGSGTSRQKCVEETVRKMQERLTKEFDRMHKKNFMTPEVRQWIIDQIAKEMLEGEK